MVWLKLDPFTPFSSPMCIFFRSLSLYCKAMTLQKTCLVSATPTLQYQIVYAMCQAVLTCNQLKPDLSIRMLGGEPCFNNPKNKFPLLLSPVASCFKPLQQTPGIVHGEVRCLAMETHFMRLLTHSSYTDFAMRCSLELCSK